MFSKLFMWMLAVINKMLFAGFLAVSAVASFIVTFWLLGAPPRNIPTIEKQSQFSFGAEGGSGHLLKSGWAKAESWGVWSLGKDAVLTLPIGPELVRKLKIKFKVRAFLHGEHKKQTVDIYLGNKYLDKWSIDIKRLEKQFSLTLDGSDLANSKEINLRFHVHEPRSPKQMQMNNDDRLIGIGLLSADLVAYVENSVYIQE